MVRLRRDEDHPVGESVGVGQVIKTALLGTTVDTTGTADDHQTGIGTI